MPEVYTHLCRSAAAGRTNPKVKTGTAALGNVRDWCHNYDLTKPTPLQDLSHSRPVRQATKSSVSMPYMTALLCLLRGLQFDNACREACH